MSQKTKLETFSAGSPLKYALKGVGEIPSADRRNANSFSEPISEQYGSTISGDTGDIIERLHTAVDGMKLVEAVQLCQLNEAQNYDELLAGVDLEEDEPANLGRVMQELDQKLGEAHAPRDKNALKVSKQKNRETVYIPELIEMAEGGTVYMAKTLSTTTKTRIAWDLNDSNQVVVVDDYEKWENLLGWKKLKNFPHGKNQIREELGDQLSGEVLDSIASDTGGDTETKSDDGNTSSRGRRTRTAPTDEVINVATSRRHHDRFKRKSKDITEAFEDDGFIGSEYSPVKMLVLFPTTTDLNMSDHYWVAGKRWPDSGKVAIGNCNKGTFEYLAEREEVWHIEDYLAQAGDYEFGTNHGAVTMDTIDCSSLVIHVMPERTKNRMSHTIAGENMPELLPEYCEDNMFHPPELPHSDDMLYAPLTKEQVFWMRPALRDSPDATILYAKSSPRDVHTTHNLSSDYKLYARARLPDWDFSESKELQTLDGASYNIDMNDGGFELVETLGKLHDAGMQPFSETPEARWSE